jgi:hypothetical protein
MISPSNTFHTPIGVRRLLFLTFFTPTGIRRWLFITWIGHVNNLKIEPYSPNMISKTNLVQRITKPRGDGSTSSLDPWCFGYNSRLNPSILGLASTQTYGALVKLKYIESDNLLGLNSWKNQGMLTLTTCQTHGVLIYDHGWTRVY